MAELDGWAGEKLLLVLRQLGHLRATQLCSDPQAIKTLRSRLVTKWLQLLSASFVRGLWLRIHMHHPAETTARAAGISAAGAWGGQTVWMAGTNVAQPATDEWVLHAFPQPGADRWLPDSAGTGDPTESDTDADAETVATQRHKAS